MRIVSRPTLGSKWLRPFEEAGPQPVRSFGIAGSGDEQSKGYGMKNKLCLPRKTDEHFALFRSDGRNFGAGWAPVPDCDEVELKKK
jgi:hypothetical protein